MKKYLILLTLFIVTLSSYAQSQLDYLLFEKICDYRQQYGLKCWKWDDKAWKVAKTHTNYQIDEGLMGHIGNSSQKKYAGERFTYYGIDWAVVGENVAVIDAQGKTINAIAERILKLWKESPIHNDLLLHPSPTQGGLSCLRGQNYKWSHNYDSWMYATLNVYKP